MNPAPSVPAYNATTPPSPNAGTAHSSNRFRVSSTTAGNLSASLPLRSVRCVSADSDSTRRGQGGGGQRGISNRGSNHLWVDLGSWVEGRGAEWGIRCRGGLATRGSQGWRSAYARSARRAQDVPDERPRNRNPHAAPRPDDS